MQLTKNFKLEEFGKNLSSYQVQLVTILATELQKVRDHINSDLRQLCLDPGKDIGMIVTSGVRTQEDYNRLLSKGHNPSKTSDHFCGFSLTGAPTLGAADIIFTNFNGKYDKLYRELVWGLGNKYQFGQMILEYNPATKVYWIHFGNDPKLIFAEPIASKILRNKLLISMNNGKTYQNYI